MKKDILLKIKNGEIKMKPSWKFEVEKISITGMWIITMLLSAGAIKVILMFGEIYGSEDVATLGEVGRQLIIEDFPYLWLIIGLVMIIVGTRINANIGNNYRKTKAKLWLITGGITVALATLFHFLAG